MSDPREKYGVNRDAEQQGAVVKIDDNEFLVRSSSAANRGYRYALAMAAERRREQLQAGGVDAFAAQDEMFIEAFAETVIVGWKNVTNGDGHELPFTRDNCIKLMRDCPDLWDQILEAARDPKRFKLSHAQEDGAKLGESSSGS